MTCLPDTLNMNHSLALQRCPNIQSYQHWRKCQHFKFWHSISSAYYSRWEKHVLCRRGGLFLRKFTKRNFTYISHVLVNVRLYTLWLWLFHKKVGYIYVDGKWSKSSNGWSWTEGYWKQIPLKKWMNLYA